MQYKSGMKILILLEMLALIAVCCFACVRSAGGENKADNRNNKKATTEMVTEAGVPLEDVIDSNSNASEVETENEGSATEGDANEEEDAISQEILDTVADMSTEDKVAQLFAVTPEIITDEAQVTVAGEVTQSALERYHVGAFVFSDWNYNSEEQMEELFLNAQTMGEDITGSKLLILGRDEREENKRFFYQVGGVDKLAKAIGTEAGLPGAGGVTQMLDDATKIAEDTECVVLHEDIDETSIEKLRQDKSYNQMIVTEIHEQEIDGTYYETSQYAVYAIQSGVDMLYASQSFEASYAAILEAVEAGDVDEERLDEAVARILAFKEKVN